MDSVVCPEEAKMKITLHRIIPEQTIAFVLILETRSIFQIYGRREQATNTLCERDSIVQKFRDCVE